MPKDPYAAETGSFPDIGGLVSDAATLDPSSADYDSELRTASAGMNTLLGNATIVATIEAGETPDAATGTSSHLQAVWDDIVFAIHNEPVFTPAAFAEMAAIVSADPALAAAAGPGAFVVPAPIPPVAVDPGPAPAPPAADPTPVVAVDPGPSVAPSGGGSGSGAGAGDGTPPADPNAGAPPAADASAGAPPPTPPASPDPSPAPSVADGTPAASGSGTPPAPAPEHTATSNPVVAPPASPVFEHDGAGHDLGLPVAAQFPAPAPAPAPAPPPHQDNGFFAPIEHGLEHLAQDIGHFFSHLFSW